MNRLTTTLYSFSLFVIPLFYLPSIFFPDQAKWGLLALMLPLVFLLGPAASALHRGELFFPSPIVPILGLLATCALSVLWATSPPLWIHGCGMWVLGIALSTVAIWRVRSIPQDGAESWPTITAPLLAAACVAAILVLAQSMGIDPFGNPFDTRHAPVASFGNTNHAAEFLAPLAAAAFALAVTQKGLWGHAGMIALFLLCAALAALKVRAGWIAAGAGLLTCFWLLWRGLTPKQRTLLVAPCIAAALGFVAPRLLLPQDPAKANPARARNTIEVRKKVYAATVRLVMANPLLGCGAGNFQTGFAPFRDPEEIDLSSQRRADPAESMVEEPHNDYLLVAAELGFVGIALLGWLGMSILRQGKRASRSLGASVAFAGIVALGVHALFRSPLTNPSSALLFWTFLGWLIAETKSECRISAKPARIGALLGILGLLAIGWFASRRLWAEWKLAQGDLAAATQLDPWDPKKWEILGRERRMGGDTMGATEAFDRLLAVHPNHFNGRLQRGLVALDQGDLPRAQAEFLLATPLDAQNPRLARAQAVLRYREGDDLSAIALLRQAIERGAAPQTLRDFGAEIEKSGQAPRALKYYQAHAEIHPDDADAWMGMGQIFRNLGDDAEARRDFARAHRLYGVDHLRLGKPEDAERQFRLYRKFAAPEDPAPDLFLAAAAYARRDRAAAEAALREAIARGARQKDLQAPGLERIAEDEWIRGLLTK